MESKLFFFLFFIFIFSLTFSSNEKENKKQKRQPKNNALNLHDTNTHDDFQNTLNFVQPNAENMQSSNTQNVKIYTHFSDVLKTKEEKNVKVPSDLLKTQVTENPNIPVDLLKIHKNAESSNVSCELLNIKPPLFRYIFAYLSFFELELNFKFVSTKIYNLYENFLQEEKNLLTEEHLNNKVKFLADINCPRVHFNFFEKRVWSRPDRIEYANVDSFSNNLFLFPKIIRQIICFQINKIEYKYFLFKDGHLSILKKLKKEKNFVFTSLENDFANFRPSFGETESCKIHSFQENIRYMEFNPYTWNSTVVRIELHKTDNFKQDIWHQQGREKILIFEPSHLWSHEKGQKVFLKDISGYFNLKGDGSLTLKSVVKQKNETHKMMEFNLFNQNVKEIKSKDFEHYAEEVLFIFNN